MARFLYFLHTLAFFADYSPNALTTNRCQPTADVASWREELLVEEVDPLCSLGSHYATCDGGDNVHDVKNGSTCFLVSDNLKRLCVNVWALNNFELCLFADYVNIDLEVKITMAEIVMDATNSEIRPIRKTSKEADKKGVVTLLFELKRSSAKVQC